MKSSVVANMISREREKELRLFRTYPKLNWLIMALAWREKPRKVTINCITGEYFQKPGATSLALWQVGDRKEG